MGKKVGIILEGGAMRSIFTAGVMDFFLEKKIDIPNIIAISAGAYAGMNYVSGQKGRVLESVVKPMKQNRILGLPVFLKTGEFFNMDLLFEKIPRGECPFDFESFKKSDKRFITSTIDCNEGVPKYFDKFNDLDEFLHIIRVANSLPLLAKVGYIDGIPMMDGGMYDAIPLSKAKEENWDKTIVVFTREKEYRKGPNGDIYNSKMVNFLYHKYKGLLEAIKERPQRYNSSIEELEALEKEGKAFVIRPEGVKLTNNESDPEKLTEYYNVGYKTAETRYEELIEFLKD